MLLYITLCFKHLTDRSKENNHIMRFNVETYFTAPQVMGHIYFEIPLQEEIDNAYNQISEYCKGKLIQKYGNWKYAVDRLDVALNFLKETNSAFDYLILKTIAELSKDENSLMLTSSQSILDYLIGTSPINPLTPHYYCPVCHNVEEVSGIKDGFDLPKKSCPKCKTEMHRDGHNCPEYLAWISKKGEVKKISGELQLSENVLRKAQGWLYKCIPNVKSHTGEFQCITFVSRPQLNLLDRIFETTRIRCEDAELLNRDIWSDTIRRIFDNQQKDMSDETKLGLFLDDNFYETELKTLSFNNLIRLISYSKSRFSEEKNINHLCDEYYYLVKDELYDLFLANSFTAHDAAYYAYCIGGPTVKRIPATYDFVNGNIDKVEYLFSKISCLNTFLLNSLLVWYEKNFPKEFETSSIGIWWYTDNGEVWAVSAPVDEGITNGMYIQYSETQNHSTLWSLMVKEHIKDIKSQQDIIAKGFKSIERGRVIYNTATMVYEIICSQNIIYNNAFRQNIVEYFHLTESRYEFVQLNHYYKIKLTGNPAIDELIENSQY